jgi:hypothetical protein
VGRCCIGDAGFLLAQSRQILKPIVYRSSLAARKIRIAKRVRKGDADFLHAQLILAGQTVMNDSIVGTSHSYYFDCGCVRAYHLNVPLGMRETLEPCEKHKGLPALARPLRSLR